MLPAGAALDKILEHTGYLALAATTPGGVEAGDLLHAVDRVRQVLEDGGNLADAADALAADSEASNEVESLPLEPGRSDVVRLMNLHKAKGLEADVVFLADPCGGMRRRVDVHIKREGEQALGWFKVEKKSEVVVRPEAPRPARRLGAARGGRGALPGRGGEPAALRRRHSRAGDAGGQLLECSEGESGLGRAQWRACCGEGPSRAREGEGRQSQTGTVRRQDRRPTLPMHARQPRAASIRRPGRSPRRPPKPGTLRR